MVGLIWLILVRQRSYRVQMFTNVSIHHLVKYWLTVNTSVKCSDGIQQWLDWSLSDPNSNTINNNYHLSFFPIFSVFISTWGKMWTWQQLIYDFGYIWRQESKEYKIRFFYIVLEKTELLNILTSRPRVDMITLLNLSYLSI